MLLMCVLMCWPTEPLRCYYELQPTCAITCADLPKGSLCTPRFVNLGPWDPRPAPQDWPREYFLPPPSPPPPVPAPSAP